LPKINIIIIESDNDLFDRLDKDLKQFSKYINKIYRCIYPNDVYDILKKRQCNLIISHNPEDVGIRFFKAFYSRPEIREKQIYGLLYLKGHENFSKFFRIARDLYEWSNHFFISVILKRYGSFEKILEVIRNIACKKNMVYPIFDWIGKDDQILFIEPEKLDTLRKLYNLRYTIATNLQPLITTLTDFNNTKNIGALKRNLHRYKKDLAETSENYLKLRDKINDSLQLEFTDGDSKLKSMKSDITYHKSQLNQFFEINETRENSLHNYLKFLHDNDDDEIVKDLVDRSNDDSIDLFLKNYFSFSQSLQGLIVSLDEFYFLK